MKITYALLAATGIALAACGGQGDDTAGDKVADQAEAQSEQLEQQADAVEEQADSATGATADQLNQQAEQLEQQADAVEEAGQAKEEAIDEADVKAPKQ